jgi:hypothetical protein
MSASQLDELAAAASTTPCAKQALILTLTLTLTLTLAARSPRSSRPPASSTLSQRQIKSSGRPPFPASLGQLAEVFWLAGHNGFLTVTLTLTSGSPALFVTCRHEAGPRGQAQVGSAALP